MIRNAILHAVVGILVPISMIAQTQQTIKNRTMLIDYGDRFYADAYVVPLEGKDSATLVVFFRMANDFLLFTKVTRASEIGGNYRADMNVSIELRDTLGVIRQRIKWKDVAYTNTYDETSNKNESRYGWQRMVIGPGTYVATLEILAQKESAQKKLKLQPVSFTPKRPTRQLTPPVFGEPMIVNGKDMTRLFVFNNNLPFGPSDGRALFLVSDTVPTNYDYTITQLPWEARDIRWWRVDSVQGQVRSERNRFPRISSASSTHGAFLEMVTQPVPDKPIATVEITIPLVAMVPGRYQLQLSRNGSTDTISMRFQIVWEMMPFSLRTVDYAIESMRYICTDEEIDLLSSGSATENREALMAYWRQRDPTPATVVNERLSEYFRRVDNSFFAFSTIAEPDGAQSDRGKVYILYGQPTDIKKNLTSTKSQEVWVYTTGIKQTFTFELNDRGQYKLVNVK